MKEMKQEQEVDFGRVIAKLRGLSHPNIAKYIDVVVQSDTIDILMEYAPAGSVKNVIQNFGSLNEKVTQVYTRQILSGLQFLHTNKIVHNDLKASNVLVDNEAIVKLSDFGFAQLFLSAWRASDDPPMWLPPEFFCLSDEPTKESADVWSLGILVLEMITGKENKWDNPALFRTEAPSVAKIVGDSAFEKHMASLIPHNISANCRAFVQSCLQYREEYRPSIRDLLSHPFLGGAEMPEKDRAAALKQIRSQIYSLSISTSQHINIRRPEKSHLGPVSTIYSINSLYLGGLSVATQEIGGLANSNIVANNRKAEDQKSQNLRFSSSVDSSGTIEPIKVPAQGPGQSREDVLALEMQLMREKEMMLKLVGYAKDSKEESKI